MAVAASPAAASTLGPPTGHYHGVNSHNLVVSFSLDSDYEYVRNFKVHGNVWFAKVKFHLDNLGYFNTRYTNGMHIWGHMPSSNYGHADGGYSWLDSHGNRHARHWYAKAEGF